MLYDTQKNFTEAEKYYKLAADQGDKGAQYNLGCLYDTQKKFALAEQFYRLAANQGDIDAQYNIGIL